MLTVGTSKILDEFLEHAGLISSHNYAVLGKSHPRKSLVSLLTRQEW